MEKQKTIEPTLPIPTFMKPPSLPPPLKFKIILFLFIKK